MSEKQFLVLGAGRFGSAVATTLYQLEHEVVVVDRDKDVIEDLVDEVTHALIADVTDEDVLRKLGANDFDAIIVAIGENLEANILATVAAKSVGAKHVISKATSDVAARILSKVGADQIIRPEHDMGVQLAKQLDAPNLLAALDLGHDFEVIEYEVRYDLQGKLSDLRLPNRFGVQVITVNRHGTITVSPGADFVLRKGDKILLLGATSSIERLLDDLGQS